MEIIFLDRATLAEQVVFARPDLADCRWREYPTTAPRQVAERAATADVIITNKVPLDAAQIERLPALRLIAVAATGVDHIDLDAARRRGVAVCNVRDYAQHSVPEHVFALLLALRRQINAYHLAVRRGDWSRAPCFTLHDYPIHDLEGGAFGVIGGGNLGQAVARLAAAFGMRVLLAERRDAPSARPGRVAFEQVLRDSDVVSLHAPLNDETRHLIGAAELALMKPSAILINTARGGVVDEQALAAALRSRRLYGACVDVLSAEPPPPDHPLLAADLPNLIITPHVAWASLEAQDTLAREVSANIEAYFRGERRNRVV